jgi:hypothetical protein
MGTLETKRGIPVDVTLDGSFSGTDPFFSEIHGVFTRVDGQKLSIPGFYRGNNQWSVRFSFAEDSDWTYRIYSDSVALKGETTGAIQVKGEAPGAAKILRTQGTKFVTADGKSVFLLGIECNFLFSLLASPGGTAKLEKFVSNIKAVGFNQVQINAYASDYFYFKGRTRENDFGGPAYIDLWDKAGEGRQFNPAFFDNYDKLIGYLNQNGIYAHIYLRVYNKYVTLPENYSKEDYTYYRLFTARYQAFPNVIWNITKEGYFEPDKNYLFTMLSQVRNWDAYKHLCTVHDDLQYSLDEKFGTTIDFLTLQQHFDWQHAHLYFLEKSGKPVIGGETGVESPEIERCNRYAAERVCQIAYEIVMTGAYYQYYNAFIAWDVIEYDSKPKGYEYISRMVKFFSQFDLKRFKEARYRCVWSGLCLDDEESTMLVYVEPREHILNYINKEGHSLINLTFDREVISCEAFGVYTGKKENYDLKDQAHSFDFNKEHGFGGRKGKDLAVLRNLPDEPTVFVIRYRRINA